MIDDLILKAISDLIYNYDEYSKYSEESDYRTSEYHRGCFETDMALIKFLLKEKKEND